MDRAVKLKALDDHHDFGPALPDGLPSGDSVASSANESQTS
jgi:hypothetical protein